MTTRKPQPEEAVQADAAEAPEPTEYIEYTGSPEHGIEFFDHRVISVADAKAAWDIDIPEDLRWSKALRNGKPRMLLEADKVPTEVRDLLLEDKSFRTTLK